MTEVGDLFFIKKFVGSRDAISIAETSCGWIADTVGKTAIELFQIVIHLDRVEAFFSDVNCAIDLALPFTDLGEIEKEYRLFEKSDSAYRITKLVIECLTFFSDTAAALHCLGLVGVVALAPSVEGLAFTARTVGVCASLLELAQRVYDNYLMVRSPYEYQLIKEVESQEVPNLSRDWSQNLCTMIADICQISHGLFKGLEFYYGLGSLTPAVYRFWRTTGALAHGLGTYIEGK